MPHPRQRLEETYAWYQDMNLLLNRVMDFTYTLERIDLEDATYHGRAMEAIIDSEGRLEEIAGLFDKLRDYRYGRELASLEAAMRPYLEELESALGETASIIETSKKTMEALEPALKVEAELTLMDPPENNQVQLERLLKLDEGLSATLNALEEIDAPEAMGLYLELNREMFESLRKTARLLIQAIRGEIPITEQPSNPDFDRFQLILENYRVVVRSIHETLKLYDLDRLAGEVDDAYFRLFIEYREDE